jgi:hypothetical protein
MGSAPGTPSPDELLGGPRSRFTTAGDPLYSGKKWLAQDAPKAGKGIVGKREEENQYDQARAHPRRKNDGEAAAHLQRRDHSK